VSQAAGQELIWNYALAIQQTTETPCALTATAQDGGQALQIGAAMKAWILCFLTGASLF
jgi:hypothetical protein